MEILNYVIFNKLAFVDQSVKIVPFLWIAVQYIPLPLIWNFKSTSCLLWPNHINCISNCNLQGTNEVYIKN